jgi:hypothetical protein
MKELIHQYGAWIVFALVFLESIGLPLPGEAILVSAAIFAGTTQELGIARRVRQISDPVEKPWARRAGPGICLCVRGALNGEAKCKSGADNGDRLDILVSWSRTRGDSVAPTASGECRPTLIELFKLGGEGAGIQEILDRHADLKIARSIYRTRIEEYPGRLIMLCDHARVLARSDQP